MTRYRVARDMLLPKHFWAVQQWRWWCPIWMQLGGPVGYRDDAERVVAELEAATKSKGLTQ